MAAFEDLVRSLRQAEVVVAKQLEGIRQAISSLEFGGAASPAVPQARRGRPPGSTNRKQAGAAAGDGRRRRKMSAAARRAISEAQKKRWAKQKAGSK